MALDIQDLASKMLAAALPILKQGSSDAASFAKVEFTKIAQTIASIEEQRNAVPPQLTDEQAALLLDMQKHASRAVLLALQGLALLTVEAAINAALDAVKAIVNAALPTPLI